MYIQEWTERNVVAAAGVGRPSPADYCTLGARRPRPQVYNGAVPAAISAGASADNPITAATNR